MKVEVHELNGFKLIRTTEAIPAGEMVLDLSDSRNSMFPTRTSIRVGFDQHAEHPLGRYVNHSCEPSCVVMGRHIVALTDLPPGTEVTFDYTENEGVLYSPFLCLKCGKQITGPPPPCQETF